MRLYLIQRDLEIRTGALKDDKKVTLKEGQKFTLTTREVIGDETIGHITRMQVCHRILKQATRFLLMMV